MRIAIWADTESRAVAAAYGLGLNPAQVVILGNRSVDKVRGMTLDLVLALPGVDRSKGAIIGPSLVRSGGSIIHLGDVA